MAESYKQDAQNAQTGDTEATDQITRFRQSIYKEEEIRDEINRRSTADQPASDPAPVTQPAVAASSTDKGDGTDSDTTLHLVTEIVRSTRTAQSIIRENGEEVCRRQAQWWTHRSASKGDGDKGALFRVACREDWPALSEAGAAKAERDTEAARTRRYVTAPRPATAPTAQNPASTTPAPSDDHERLEAIYASLSSCAQERLDAEVIKRACTDNPAMAPRIRQVVTGAIPASPAISNAVTSARYAVLHEREAAAKTIGGKVYYDAQEARAAQIDLDFA